MLLVLCLRDANNAAMITRTGKWIFSKTGEDHFISSFS